MFDEGLPLKPGGIVKPRLGPASKIGTGQKIPGKKAVKKRRPGKGKPAIAKSSSTKEETTSDAPQGFVDPNSHTCLADEEGEIRYHQAAPAKPCDDEGRSIEEKATGKPLRVEDATAVRKIIDCHSKVSYRMSLYGRLKNVILE